jgi:hypothetical protein
MPLWLAIPLVLLPPPLIVFVRYGGGWAATEIAVLIACVWVAARVKHATWFARHLVWAFAYFVVLMTALFFDLAALVLGLWLSAWSSLVVALGAGVLSVAGIWPAQLRFYKQRRHAAASE